MEYNRGLLNIVIRTCDDVRQGGSLIIVDNLFYCMRAIEWLSEVRRCLTLCTLVKWNAVVNVWANQYVSVMFINAMNWSPEDVGLQETHKHECLASHAILWFVVVNLSTCQRWLDFQTPPHCLAIISIHFINRLDCCCCCRTIAIINIISALLWCGVVIPAAERAEEGRDVI